MKARILTDLILDGLQYRSNQVADLPADLAKTLAKDGAIDTDKAAVAYCVDELGARVIVHETEQQRAAKEALLAAETARDRLKAELSAQTDAAARAALSQSLVEAEAAVTAATAAAS